MTAPANGKSGGILPPVLMGALAALIGTQLMRIGVPWKFGALYDSIGNKYGVDPNLLHALALKETVENPTLIGPPNADGSRDYGLMQINESNFARLGVTSASLLDPATGPATSIDAAARLLLSDKQAAPGLNVLDQMSVYNAGWGRDPKTGALRPRLSKAGVYINTGSYVLPAFAWYVAVVLGRLALVQKLP